MADFFEICKKPGLKANFARKLNAIIQNDIKPSNIKNLYYIKYLFLELAAPFWKKFLKISWVKISK